MGSHWTIATRINKERRTKNKTQKKVIAVLNSHSSKVSYGNKKANEEVLREIAANIKKENRER